MDLRKGLLGPQVPVIVARAMAATGTTVGDGARAPEVDGVMVRGLADLLTVLEEALAMALVLVLAQARAQGTATGQDMVAAVVVVVEEVEARVRKRSMVE